ncbi:MAG: VCBS repeat-containing protein [Flavisolibacter sp.]
MKASPKVLYSIIYLLGSLLFSCKTKTLFNQLSSSRTGIHFNNKITETDSLNPLDNTNIYNGGGVGIGDFNNDGLLDIYFTGNQVSNKLYLNKGSLKFQDITDEAGVEGKGHWNRGVAVVDINNDGWLDIYVCATFSSDSNKRRNLLYINQGADKNGIPHFKEMASEYGLDLTTHSTMAEFFDYDNDGDLDMYLVVNEIVKGENTSFFRPKKKDGSFPSTGKLFRNDWDPVLKHPVFHDVSKQAGITIEGYGHSATIADFNKDGWKDIYVTNDFNTNDLLYINNHDGSFTDKAAIYFKHTSANGMGQDVIDINNDGLSDVIELDMSPEDNYRKKMMLGSNNYQNYQNSDYFGYQYQYVRNSLQLNQGPRVNAMDSVGDPVFSDIGFFCGIAETDWSWTPLVQDFDNDGFRDIIITNGFPRDITDHDFIAFRRESSAIATKQYTLDQIPKVKIHNYAFHNNGNLTFTNTTPQWGLTQPSFSNGAAYADLDNDGDLDIVINNIDDEAFVYENTAIQNKQEKNHFLTVSLKGDALNINGLGAWVELYYQGKMQVYEQSPYRGYLSSVQQDIHFGMGKTNSIDSVVVKWPNNKKQLILNQGVDKILKLNIADAKQDYSWSRPVVATNTLLRDITSSVGVNFQHEQKDFIDFNIQKLLPHKFSEYGPALCVGDVDGNGLDDIIVGGNYSKPGIILLQQKDGQFLSKDLGENRPAGLHWQDMGITLFDADKDGDLDMYISRGGYQDSPNTACYQDGLYINDGKGNFTLQADALPPNFISKSCVRVADFDNDGDLDIFIGGRVEPWNYPKPVTSYILRNDTRDGVIKFTDVTETIAKPLVNIGLVCDAIWTDFDNDGWMDLIITGEWMPIKFIKNDHGVFKDISQSSGLQNKLGWWTSIVAGDFNNDGKTDYVVGNLGLNSFYRASETYPVHIYAKDFDKDGTYDAIPSIYLPSSQEDTVKREFPVHSKDDITKQLNSFRKNFPTYKSYATATFDKMFTFKEMEGALKLEANYFSNSLLKNKGNGKFELIPLPQATQYSCMNGMVAEDIDGDGNMDILINGNDYGTEPTIGRYDACNGLLLKGNGKGNFTAASILESGWYIPGNGKALVKLRNGRGGTLLAASQNKGPLKLFEVKGNQKSIPLNPFETSAMVRYKNGTSQKREINYGSSFLSQSGRFFSITDNVLSIDIKDNKGNHRVINF